MTRCASLPHAQWDKWTVWRVEAQKHNRDARAAKQLVTIGTVLSQSAAPSPRAGAYVRARHSKQGRAIPGLSPEKREVVFPQPAPV